MDLQDLRDRDVLVAGWGVSGRALVAPLRDLGARITVLDAKPVDGMRAVTPDTVRVDEFALVVTSPGFRPTDPTLTAAAARGIPVWGDIEFAWRLDQAQVYGPARTWLVVTGTNGKTTTTSMLHAILEAAERPSAACGNIGLPVVDVLRTDAQVLAMELSSFQLHWAPSVRPRAGVILNIAEDHLDWHGGMPGYIEAKLQALTGAVGVLGLDDPVAGALGPRSQAERTIGFRLGEPGADELGVVGNRLVDRAFGDGVDAAGAVESPGAGVDLIGTDEIDPPGPAGILDALAAAALARSVGVAPEAVAAGLRAHRVGPHRATRVRELNGVTFVDDSKATNPHAARSSLLAHPRVVWIAGGQLKGAAVDELVAEVAPRLVGAVLIGQDAAQIAAAMSRHAPEVPVVSLPPGDDAEVTMGNAVTAAATFARPGDAVLLAPAAASLDMFRSYGHRGDAFAAAANSLTEDDLA